MNVFASLVIWGFSWTSSFSLFNIDRDYWPLLFLGCVNDLHTWQYLAGRLTLTKTKAQRCMRLYDVVSLILIAPLNCQENSTPFWWNAHLCRIRIDNFIIWSTLESHTHHIPHGIHDLFNFRWMGLISVILSIHQQSLQNYLINFKVGSCIQDLQLWPETCSNIYYQK